MFTGDDYKNVKGRLFIKVSNAEWDREILEKVPHRRVCDLAITYHVLISNDREGVKSCMVNNEMLERFGISKEQLHEDAVAGSMAQFPSTFGSLASCIGVSHEDNKLFIVSNRDIIFGASALFYNGMLDTIRKRVRGNYYILPSSRHEMLVLKANKDVDPENLASMVKEINRFEVSPEDRLRDHVYYCHVKNGERRIVIAA